MCLPRALICLEPGTEGPLRLSQGTPFRSHVPCVQCPSSLSGNFLSQKTSASPHLHLRGSPSRRDSRKAEPTGPIFLSSASALPALWTQAPRVRPAGEKPQKRARTSLSSWLDPQLHPPPPPGSSPWPGAEETRREKCSCGTQQRRWARGAPCCPGGQSVWGFCLCGWGRVSGGHSCCCPGQVGGLGTLSLVRKWKSSGILHKEE